MGGIGVGLKCAAAAALGGGIVLTLLLSEERRKAALRDEIRRAVMSAGSRKPERRGQGEGTRGLEKGGVAEWMLKGTVDTEADQDPSGRAPVWTREQEDRYTAANGDEVSEYEIGLILEKDKKPVSEFFRLKYEREANKFWDKFYYRNEANFFKDRHYLHREWTDLLNGGIKVLDAGCGVGNAAIPLLGYNPDMHVWACDFSKNAVEIMQEEQGFDAARCKAWVADVTVDDLAQHTGEGAMDYALLIFVLSAISPSLFVPALRNIASSLRAGGEVLFRDYGLFDMAQLKMAAPKKNKISDNFYVRGDGTRAYFFSETELEGLFAEAGFEKVDLEMHKRVVKNRKEGTYMHRRWVQGRFRKL